MEFSRRLLAKFLVLAVPALGALALAPSWAAGAGLTRLHVRVSAVQPGAGGFSFGFGPRQLPLRVPHAGAYASAKQAAQRAYATWAARHPSNAPRTGAGTPAQTAPSPQMAPAPQTAQSPQVAPAPQAALFEGLNAAGVPSGEPDTLGTPPDTTGAIGPNDYVEFVNSQIAVFNRSGLSLIEKKSEDAFTGGKETCDGQIRWDQQAERWEYASLDCNVQATTLGFSFGWSKTADPTNLGPEAWCRYHAETGKFLLDFPKLGGDDDFLMIGVNVYEFPSESYVQSGFFSIAKPAKGSTACPTGAELGFYEEFPTPFTPVPASTYGSSSAGYVVASEYPASATAEAKNLFLYKVTKGTKGEPIAQRSTIPVGGYFVPAAVPQPGTTDGLDSSDTRITQAAAAEDPGLHEVTVWTQHTVAPTLGTPSVVRWYQVRAASATLAQEGSAEGSTGNFAFNGAISPTARGNGAVIDFNVGGPALAAQLHAESRAPTTTAGHMEGDVLLAESEAVDKDFTCPSAGTVASGASCRWGDYAGASPDPVNPAVVWGTGEINGPQVAEFGAQWKTRNFALALRAAAQGPKAAFSVSTASPTGGSPVSFDASSSSDAVEPIVSYEWSFGDGSAGSGEKPAHVFARPGKYTVKLTVMDDGGLTSSTEREVTVADAPPTAAFAAPAPTATVPVGFDGSASKDPDGTVASYEWSFGDGSGAQGPTPSHTYSLPGSYTVTLTVTDDGRKSTSVSHLVTVADAPPSASFTLTGAAPTAGMPATFDASASKDPDGTIASYAWSFGDGTSAGGMQPAHVYAKAGAYTVKLTVTDNGGLTASSEQQVSVRLPSNVIQILSSSANRRTGGVALVVAVPGPGVLSAADSSRARASDVWASIARALAAKHSRKKTAKALVKAVTLNVAQAGNVTLAIEPSTAARALLASRHKLTVKLRISFTPTDGVQSTTSRSVVLKQPAKKKKRRRK